MSHDQLVLHMYTCLDCGGWGTTFDILVFDFFATFSSMFKFKMKI